VSVSKPEVEHEDFQEAYQPYPKHVDRRIAHKAYLSALKRGATHKEILAGIHRYAKSDTVQRGFVKNMATWLNADGWKDDYVTAQPSLPTFKPAGDIQERYMARIKAQQEATTA
jgi:hypothetical protein